jgi:hypothetical protein
MSAVQVCKFYLQFAWMGVEKCDRFYLDFYDGCYGEFSPNLPADNFTGKESRCDWGFPPEKILAGFRYARKAMLANNGEMSISYYDGRKTVRVYEKGSAWPDHRNPPNLREKVDCPCLNALMDYLDHGDEADLCAALDMLTDAGKFDPE